MLLFPTLISQIALSRLQHSKILHSLHTRVLGETELGISALQQLDFAKEEQTIVDR